MTFRDRVYFVLGDRARLGEGCRPRSESEARRIVDCILIVSAQKDRSWVKDRSISRRTWSDGRNRRRPSLIETCGKRLSFVDTTADRHEDLLSLRSTKFSVDLVFFTPCIPR